LKHTNAKKEENKLEFIVLDEANPVLTKRTRISNTIIKKQELNGVDFKFYQNSTEGLE
jgi:hypothetical protein